MDLSLVKHASLTLVAISASWRRGGTTFSILFQLSLLRTCTVYYYTPYYLLGSTTLDSLMIDRYPRVLPTLLKLDLP